ncbi:hypothetical protein [Phreatobacter oligotrophus]|uniref:Uncharacterized protein n=1 Tax=Phreatobacter oligotrophus TaxID=1122261 RepID=A0A2T4YX17_9HYPH|nr:hypothetical protein [Phreatobacter oligotrophus]PTM49910.1 hypothetical protein C8P69_11624 [Phreatobacter oligotrophus]
MKSFQRFAVLAAVIAAICTVGPALAEGLRPCRPEAIWRPARVASGERLSPAPANTAGCIQGAELPPDPQLRLWRCPVDPSEGHKLTADGAVILLSYRGQPWQALPDEVSADGYLGLDIATVDLDGDGDGAAERVLATWNSQSNGLGINRWTVRVFTADWLLVSTYEDVAEWSVRNLVRAPPPRKGCDLALTRFAEQDGTSANPGMALQARFLRFEGRQMQPADDRPVLTRRYDRRFEAERNKHYRRSRSQDRGDILRWLSHADVVRSSASSSN